MKQMVRLRHGRQRRLKKEDGQTLQSMGIKILIPIFLALFGLLICLAIGVSEVQRLAVQYAEDTAELYVDQINYDMMQIDKELVLVLENSEEIGQIPADLDSTQGNYYHLLQKIRNQNQIMKLHYREVDRFFVYEEQSDVLFFDSGTVFSYSFVDEFTEILRGFCRENACDGSRTPQWTYLDVDGEVYLVGWYAKKGSMIGCAVKLQKIFSLLQEMPDLYQVIPYMKKPDGTVILSEEYEKLDLDGMNGTKNSQVYEFQLGTLGKICICVIPEGGILEGMLQMQVILVVLVIMLLLFCLSLLYRYYQGLMKPLNSFVQGISEMEEEQMLNENGKNNILELEAVSERFRVLLRKIRSLKIAIYEKELNEQRAELEYMQEQIRPHFMLNCLSLIHGIADAQGEEKITRITKELSEYIRYNYRESGTERSLTEELAHVKTYMDLQKLRYGEEAFRFEVIEDGPEGNYLLPPLVLQTLVENSVIHAVNLDQTVEISLYIACESYEDGTYLYICESDTGKGFLPEIIEAVERDLPIVYNGRKHVGLQNIRRRLKLLYGERASMTIQNMDENYGAVVEIRIPQSPKAEKE